jgi:phenylacetate-CoA ligase
MKINDRNLDPRAEETFSCNDITTLQEKEWTLAYRHAFDGSPFYREHLKAAGLSRDQVPPLADIGVIPPIDRDLFTDRTEDFMCVPDRDVIDIVTTSGSTGRPLVTALTESDLTRLAYNEYLSFRCAGITPDDKVILAVTLDRCFIAGMAYFLGLRMLGASVIRVGAGTPAMHLELIDRLHPSAIVGVPSFLSLIADRAAEAGFDLVNSSVKKAVCIGDPLRAADLTLNTTGQSLEDRWGMRLFSTYGNTEIATSLCECSAGAGNHLHPELLYLETVDEQGNPTPEGVAGELVATTFRVQAMPLIRYRLGDYALLINTPCSCGRVTQRISPILGRKDHKLKVKGTTLFPSTLQVVLDASPDVLSYVIVARKAPDLSDTLEVKVCWRKERLPRAQDALRERLQAEARVSPSITVATESEIDHLQNPEGKRKRRVFVDLRAEGDR